MRYQNKMAISHVTDTLRKVEFITRKPGKYRLVDKETGEVWANDDGLWKRAEEGYPSDWTKEDSEKEIS